MDVHAVLNREYGVAGYNLTGLQAVRGVVILSSAVVAIGFVTSAVIQFPIYLVLKVSFFVVEKFIVMSLNTALIVGTSLLLMKFSSKVFFVVTKKRLEIVKTITNFYEAKKGPYQKQITKVVVFIDNRPVLQQVKLFMTTHLYFLLPN